MSLAVHTRRLRDSFCSTISNRLNVVLLCDAKWSDIWWMFLALQSVLMQSYHFLSGVPSSMDFTLECNFWVSFISYILIILEILSKYMSRISLMMSLVVLWYLRVSLWLLGFWFWIVWECYTVGSLFLFWCPFIYCLMVYRAQFVAQSLPYSIFEFSRVRDGSFHIHTCFVLFFYMLQFVVVNKDLQGLLLLPDGLDVCFGYFKVFLCFWYFVQAKVVACYLDPVYQSSEILYAFYN